MAPGGERFRYDGYDLDPATGRLECRYSLGPWRFTEKIAFDLPDGPSVRAGTADAVDEAARLVYLLAGVSYYKTAAPPSVDLGPIPTTESERRFLRTFFVDGLGEFAYRNGLDLTRISISGPERADARPVSWDAPGDRPLVPFGAGIDSIVTLEAVRRRHRDLSLFVVGRGGDRFEAIEQAARVSGLPIARAERAIDPAVLRSPASGFLNGHVPVTGVLSAIAVMAAVLGGYDAVVMSNERSASTATLEVDGRPVNHQWSKGLAFEEGWREVLAGVLAPPPRYFSFLRSRSELWVGREFAALSLYHDVFRSCNRAFYTDPAQRLDHWCGICDKCCFIDLVLSPFLGADVLDRIFGGHEPLGTPALEAAFRALLGVGSEPRPFECVGDVHECRAAAILAAERADRDGCSMLHDLASWARDAEAAAGVDPQAAAAGLFAPEGAGFVPADFAADEHPTGHGGPLPGDATGDATATTSAGRG